METAEIDRSRQARVLALLALAELLVMSLWFSASAVVPELEGAWSLSAGAAAWLTMSVQLGFVVGAVLSAFLTLSDVWNPRWLLFGSALAGAAATASIAAFSRGPGSAVPLRFLTGMALAGVYPPGMKIMAGWFRKRRGLAIGVLVGALTVGSAAPHLLRAASGPTEASLLAFGTIAIGGAGAWLAGEAADRLGRTRVTTISMVVSGSCCLAAGAVFGASPLVVVPFCLVWGFAIVADSAQFSTSVTELAEQSYVGTALTLQTAVGFLLTMVTIRLLPEWRAAWGWGWAFAPLAAGPAVGTLAMQWLRRRPEARRLAGGRG